MANLSWLEINLDNLKQNIINLRSLIKPQTKFMAVVKSNAYGHGMIECAQAAVEAGADWLGVVNINEAITLRQAEAKLPIMVLGYVELGDVQSAAQKQVSIPVVNLEYARRLAEIKLIYPLKVHLKAETGISRLGMDKKEIWQAYQILSKNKKIVFEGLYSHLAAVEEANMEYTKKQLKTFNNIIADFAKRKISFPYKHIAASGATLLLPESHYNLVRCGISIYGLWPSRENCEQFSRVKSEKLKVKSYGIDFLKPVMEYKTKIVQIKNIKRGTSIGYGCTYTANRNMTIAVIPVGYYEGFDRRLSNPGGKGEVIIDGTKCPVVGRVCMNMTVIDISRLIPNSQFSIPKLYNEEVVIIGKQASRQARGAYAEITADEIAEKSGTINYEIVSQIPEHIKRVYK